MKAPPAVLLTILLLLTACYGDRRQQMLGILDEADSLNRNYIPFATDSQLLAATRFFDAHGTSLEQLRAHYLLGCAYRDLGQAPEALQAWHDAIDRADTTSRDSAVLERLMAVYGQMAEMYHSQHLPHDEIKVMKRYAHLALLTKDTLKYIKNIELQVGPYEQLGDTMSMLSTLSKAKNLYEVNGYHEEAIQTLCTPIFIAIERGELGCALAMMKLYESQSGLFDAGGNIRDGREVYYYIKGLYYLKSHQLDSAEAFMRKLLPSLQNVNAYRGLLEIYLQRGNPDSISTFVKLFEKAVDEKSNARETEAIHQISAPYDYQHSERIAYMNSLENQKLKELVFCLVLLSIIIFVILYSVYYKTKKQKKQAELQYIANVAQLREVRQELLTLKRHEEENQIIINRKKRNLELLETQIREYQQIAAGAHTSGIDEKLSKTDIYNYFHAMANKGQKPLDEDWLELEKTFMSVLPETYHFINIHRSTLDTTAYHVCMLVRIHIKPTPISHMIGVSDAYISQVRKDLLLRLFHISGKPKEFDMKICSFS